MLSALPGLLLAATPVLGVELQDPGFCLGPVAVEGPSAGCLAAGGEVYYEREGCGPKENSLIRRHFPFQQAEE
ncbi:unnamed protein product [Boreogadus saida]